MSRALEKTVLHLLSRQDTCEGWCCYSDRPKLQQALRELHKEGFLDRRKAANVLPGYEGSAYAYRIPPNPTARTIGFVT